MSLLFTVHSLQLFVSTAFKLFTVHCLQFTATGGCRA